LAVVAKLSNTRASNELTALDALSNLCATDMARVNQQIIDNMESKVPLIPQLAGHLIAAGGKRLRPFLHWPVQAYVTIEEKIILVLQPQLSLFTQLLYCMMMLSTILTYGEVEIQQIRYGAINQVF